MDLRKITKKNIQFLLDEKLDFNVVGEIIPEWKNKWHVLDDISCKYMFSRSNFNHISEHLPWEGNDTRFLNAFKRKIEGLEALSESIISDVQERAAEAILALLPLAKTVDVKVSNYVLVNRLD